MSMKEKTNPLHNTIVVTRAILTLIAEEMKRHGVERVEDLKLPERSQEEIELQRSEIRALIDKEPIKPVVPQCISAPGYESGLAASIKEEQQNCPYCHEPYKAIGVSDEIYEDDGEGIFVKDGKLIALSECGYIRFEQKIKLCPMCGRKLEA